MFAEDERNRRGVRQQVSLWRGQAQEKSPGVAPVSEQDRASPGKRRQEEL